MASQLLSCKFEFYCDDIKILAKLEELRCQVSKHNSSIFCEFSNPSRKEINQFFDVIEQFNESEEYDCMEAEESSLESFVVLGTSEQPLYSMPEGYEIHEANVEMGQQENLFGRKELEKVKADDKISLIEGRNLGIDNTFKNERESQRQKSDAKHKTANIPMSCDDKTTRRKLNEKQNINNHHFHSKSDEEMEISRENDNFGEFSTDRYKITSNAENDDVSDKKSCDIKRKPTDKDYKAEEKTQGEKGTIPWNNQSPYAGEERLKGKYNEDPTNTSSNINFPPSEFENREESEGEGDDDESIGEGVPIKVVSTRCSNLIVKIYKGDITKLSVDIIVNAANKYLRHGGGVARAIAESAGIELKLECDSFTKSHIVPVSRHYPSTGGNLQAKEVYHAIGPQWDDYRGDQKEECERDLRLTILRCLMHADKVGYRSIAFPAISSAIFRVPTEICVKSYLKAVQHFDEMRSKYHQNNLKEVHFVDINDNMVAHIQEHFWDYISIFDNKDGEFEADRQIMDEEYLHHPTGIAIYEWRAKSSGHTAASPSKYHQTNNRSFRRPN